MLTPKQELMVTENFGLVKKIANSMQSRIADHTLSFDDLVSEGYIGLIHSAIKYDGSRGTTFATYAYPTIAGHMLRAMQRPGFASVPFDVAECIRQIRKHNLFEESREVIAARLKCKVCRVDQALYVMKMRPVSFQSDIDSDHQDFMIEDIVGANADYSIAEVQEFLSMLTPRERFFLDGVLEGVQRRELGARRGIGSSAVSYYLKSVRTKYKAYLAAAQ